MLTSKMVDDKSDDSQPMLYWTNPLFEPHLQIAPDQFH